MNASTMIVLAVVAVLAVFSARRMYDTFFGKGGCHGGGGGGAQVKRVKVADANEANYPYAQDVRIGGMTCDRCAATVENALNALDGVWARVDLGEGSARVLSKAPLDLAAVKDAVTAAGYYVVRNR